MSGSCFPTHPASAKASNRVEDAVVVGVQNEVRCPSSSTPCPHRFASLRSCFRRNHGATLVTATIAADADVKWAGSRRKKESVEDADRRQLIVGACSEIIYGNPLVVRLTASSK